MLNKFFNYKLLSFKLFFKSFFNFLILFSLIFLILISSSVVYSSNYYADIEVELTNDGKVTINGVTNYAGLKNISNSQSYTSKKGEMWILNISTDEVFDDFIFKINFPAGVEINYIKTTPKFRIEDNGESISLIGIGENQELNILIQYKINEVKNKNSYYSIDSYFFIFSFFLLIFVLFIIYFAYKKFKIIKLDENNNLNSNISKLENLDSNKINLELLSGRQKEIVEILLKKDKISQKELQEILNIPKSSVSRNVNSLVSRGFIQKQRSGITTFISIKK